MTVIFHRYNSNHSRIWPSCSSRHRKLQAFQTKQVQDVWNYHWVHLWYLQSDPKVSKKRKKNKTYLFYVYHEQSSLNVNKSGTVLCFLKVFPSTKNKSWETHKYICHDTFASLHWHLTWWVRKKKRYFVEANTKSETKYTFQCLKRNNLWLYNHYVHI